MRDFVFPNQRPLGDCTRYNELRNEKSDYAVAETTCIDSSEGVCRFGNVRMERGVCAREDRDEAAVDDVPHSTTVVNIVAHLR